MACLGGTVEDPMRWFRYHANGRIEAGEGRTCKRTAPWATTAGERYPKAWNCGGCALFRGISWGKLVGGLDRNDLPLLLQYDEKSEWEAAEEEAFENEGAWGPLMIRFVSRMRGETYGWRHLRGITPEANEEWAAWMRAYRARKPELRAREAGRRRANRKANAVRERAATKERVRRFRARQKGNVTP